MHAAVQELPAGTLSSYSVRAAPQVKRFSSSRGETEDTLVLLSQPQTLLQRSPGCELYYSDAIRGVPHPLAKLVCLASTFDPGMSVKKCYSILVFAQQIVFPVKLLNHIRRLVLARASSG